MHQRSWCALRGNSQARINVRGMKLDAASKQYASDSSASSQPIAPFSWNNLWSIPAAITKSTTPRQPSLPQPVVNAIRGIAPGRCRTALVAQMTTGRPSVTAQIRPGTRSSQSSHPYGPSGSNSISRNKHPTTPTAAPKNIALRYPWSCLATPMYFTSMTSKKTTCRFSSNWFSPTSDTGSLPSRVVAIMTSMIAAGYRKS